MGNPLQVRIRVKYGLFLRLSQFRRLRLGRRRARQSAYSPLQSFERIARSWLAAKGDPPKEQTFWNDVVGKAYRVLGEAPPWEDIRDRAGESEYSHGSIPPGYPLLTCGVDCQGDRVEWQVVAWGQNKRCAIVDYDVFDGHISDEKCQAKLNPCCSRGSGMLMAGRSRSTCWPSTATPTLKMCGIV
ncbi:hypothetical protein MACH17_02990 [Phaeobacter inhibens]|uniref:terminase gpA endonuclease subunit n=1 Tax=Phaeobacter inhibens TaxID=221822 RepID=UPI002760F2B7|nr:terminase gpA endonuclease subunit [Phaeobacter inhibens]GLO68782.1 hypothetical protein MACH17_02990 [Phaeobacter inhibens]